MIDLVTPNNKEGISISGKSIICDGNIVDHLNSNERPLLLSELVMRMSNRNWGYPIIKTCNENQFSGYYGEMSFGESNKYFPIPEIKNPQFPVCSDYPSSDQSDLEKIYRDVLAMKEIEGITFYSSSKVTVDFLNSSITLNLLEDGDYTNTISLINIEKKLNTSGISCKVDLTVKYVKNGIYCRDLTFKAFEIKEGSVERDDFISSLDGDIMIEYIDGIIRVIPEIQEVGECIISNCILTYGCI